MGFIEELEKICEVQNISPDWTYVMKICVKN